MGLFPEIDRVWLTVDNKFCFWNYKNLNDIQTLDEMDKPIISVTLIPPKKKLFIESINYLLVLVTVTDLYIIAMTHDKEHNTIEFFDTGMSVSVKGLDITNVVASSETGRIFMTGDSDGTNVWEVEYSTVETWFKGKCTKVCHTRQYILSSITPSLPTSDISVIEKIPLVGSWIKNHESEKVVSIVIDDSRNLLYTLSNLSTIRMYYMDPKKSDLSLRYTYTTSQILSNLKMIPPSQDSSIQPPGMQNPKNFSIVSISPISQKESSLLNLVAVTSSGFRIYIKAANTSSESGPPTTMQAIQQRFPPVSGQGNTNVLSSTKRLSKVFPPGYFFGVVPSSPEGTSDKVFVAAPDSGKIIHQMAPGSNTLYFENACFLETEGFVHDIDILNSPLTPDVTYKDKIANESRIQYTVPNPRVAILTNTGIHIFVRKYPYQIFEELGQNIRPFFEFYGRTETCATALSIASQQSKFSLIETEFASKVYIELGGKPHVKVDDEGTYSLSPSTNNYSVFGQLNSGGIKNSNLALPGFSGSDASDLIRLSGRFDGLATYISRVISPIWQKHLFFVKGISKINDKQSIKQFSHNFNKKVLENIQITLGQISDYLGKNRAFIDGLSGQPNNLIMSGGRFEEISLQAEHRGLHSLVQLITSMREGLAFLSLLADESSKTQEGLESITKFLPDNIRQKLESLTFKLFFTTPEGKEVAKELITCLVNRNVNEGGSVDSISSILQDRCVSYCSADDVVIYKALECLHKAESLDLDSRIQKLNESLRLFQKAASSIPFDVLKDSLNLFASLKFYPGAVELALTVAQQEDRGNLAIGYIHDDKPAKDPRQEYFEKRLRVYELIFNILDIADQRANEFTTSLQDQPSTNLEVEEQGNWNSAIYLRDQAYAVCTSSNDEVFHYCFYDWLISKGFADRLLSIDTQFIQSYLEIKAKSDISIANLLWNYYNRRQLFYNAAEVLLGLAKSNFNLTLSQRIEYLSRAKSYCGCPSFPEDRRSSIQLEKAVQDYLDIAIIQDEILKRVQEDDMFDEEKKISVIESLSGQLLDISTLFNNYVRPLEYHDISIKIFYTTDYKGTEEINNCWSKLIMSEHAKALDQGIRPYELIAQTVQELGQYVMLSEVVFPSEFLISKLESYTVEYAPDSPEGWIVEIFLNSGLGYEDLFYIFKDLVDRREYPFDEKVAFSRLVSDVVYLLQKWSNESRLSTLANHVSLDFARLLESVVGKKPLIKIQSYLESQSR